MRCSTRSAIPCCSKGIAGSTCGTTGSWGRCRRTFPPTRSSRSFRCPGPNASFARRRRPGARWRQEAEPGSAGLRPRFPLVHDPVAAALQLEQPFGRVIANLVALQKCDAERNRDTHGAALVVVDAEPADRPFDAVGHLV